MRTNFFINESQNTLLEKIEGVYDKEVVASLNYKEGGYIYIGVDKHGETIGVDTVGHYTIPLL